MTKQQIGVIGLDDLGKDLALNIRSLGYFVSVFSHLINETKEDIKKET
jgi:6-phosphogluconate dehydrogenase